MIAANELRIGNYINDSKGKSFRVCNINSDGYLNKGYTHSKMIGSCNGIELTPDILINAGFVVATDSYGGYMSPIINGDGIRLRFDMGFYYIPSDYSKPIKILFVHSLQNFYFVMTGEELTIKL